MTLKERRENAGITQATLAEQLDIDQTTVSRWENGCVPLKKHQRKLADFYGCTIDELLSKGGN
jgi:transcriptional regulator with XRE-family HTH domain